MVIMFCMKGYLNIFDFFQIFVNLIFEEMGEAFGTRVFQYLVKRQFRKIYNFSSISTGPVPV